MDNAILEKNLAVLESRNPGGAEYIRALVKRSGVAAEESADSDDARRSAREWFQSVSPVSQDLIALLGFGYGLGCLEAVEAASDSQTFYVYERDEELFAAALATNDLTTLLRSSRVLLYVGEQRLASFKSEYLFAQEAWLNGNILEGDRSLKKISARALVTGDGAQKDNQHYLDTVKETLASTRMIDENISAIVKVYDNCDEPAEYLGMDKWSATRAISQGVSNLAVDWKNASPENAGEVHDWYCKTHNYILELCLYHATSPNYGPLAKMIVELCGNLGGRILDFGGGDGDVSIRLALQGMNVEYCDVPGETMRYAKWRFAKRNLSFPIIESTDPSTVHLEGNYDTIIALDVLEHLVNPFHYCEVFFKHLSKGGIFLAKPSFSHDDNHPMHLAENTKYAETFRAEMESIGFTYVDFESEQISIWAKTT